MSSPTIFDHVAKLVSDASGAPVAKIRPETALADLRLDSLDQLELVTDIEDAFSIDVHDREAGALRTVADVEALVRQKLRLGAGADLAEVFGAEPAS